MEQMERHTRIQRTFQQNSSTIARLEDIQQVAEVINSRGRLQSPILQGDNSNTSVSSQTSTEDTLTDEMIEAR
jgi:hypothetical protein